MAQITRSSSEGVLKRMTQNELTRPQPIGKINLNILISSVLWLVSIALTVMCIFAVRELLLWSVALLLAPPDREAQLRTANMLNLVHQCGMIILGVIDLGFIVGITEYFFRHMREPRALRLLALVVAIECAIVIPVWWLFWR
jgi:hypothetical protein